MAVRTTSQLWNPSADTTPLSGPPRLRLAWLGDGARETVQSMCADGNDVRYYCEWLRALRDSPEIDLTDLCSRTARRATSPCARTQYCCRTIARPR